tara:strand:+ start:15173 stop:16291 length:1119 start_codon:yes stop_codon:yes gene_type:complete
MTDYCRNFSPDSVASKIAAMLFGHAFGDAYGLPYEYKKRGHVHEYPYEESIRGVLPNDWTDDTDITILCMASLIENNMHFNAKDVVFKFRYWLERGLVQTGYDHPKTPSALFAEILKTPGYLENPYTVAAELNKSSAGSMRTNFPISYICFAGSTHNPPEIAAQFCKLTHPDPLCVAASVYYAVAINKLICGIPIADVMDEAAKYAGMDAQTTQTAVTKLINTGFTKSLSSFDLSTDTNSIEKALYLIGFTLQLISRADEVGATTANTSKPNFLKCIHAVALQGGDADANCGIVGALLGARYGFTILPEDITHMPSHTVLHQFTAFYINRLYQPVLDEENRAASANNDASADAGDSTGNSTGDSTGNSTGDR